MECVQSGYKTITPFEIANCLHAQQAGQISYRAVRVYSGCAAMVAIREAAARAGKRKGTKPCSKPSYGVSELAGLTGLSGRTVKRELHSLERASLVRFAENKITFQTSPLPQSGELCEKISGKRSARRPIPVPRSVLRFIARMPKAALGLTMLGYVVRGLTIERKTGEVRGVGTGKAGWIAETFGLSLRSVRAARKELIAMNFISQDTGSTQRKLNRDGSYFRINLAWKGKGASGNEVNPTANTRCTKSKIAPPPSVSCSAFAPPIENLKTSNEIKNQKTQSAVLKPAGVCTEKSGKGKEPLLRDLKVESLRNFAHLEILFQQAVKAGWLAGSEANFLNWVGAAVRATTVAARDPVRVFVSLVKRGRWDFITQEQEDRARALIRRFRETPASVALEIQTALKPVEPKTLPDIHERLLARQIIERSFPEIKQRCQF